MTDKYVGLVGVGLLGSALAERFLAAGFGVVGYDTTQGRCDWLSQAGGQAAASASDVFRRCRRTVLSLPTSQIVSQVLAPADLPAGSIVVDTTTGSPPEVDQIACQLADHGVAYLDATVSGSSKQVREGMAVVMAGGADDAFAKCGDLFATFCQHTFHVGEAGSGTRMKLVTNLVLGLNRAALAEGLALARRFELDLPETVEVLKSGAAYSRAIDAKGDKMISGDFTPEARLAQHLKDVLLLLSCGEELDLELPLSRVHESLLRRAVAAGYGEADNSAVLRAFD